MQLKYRGQTYVRNLDQNQTSEAITLVYRGIRYDSHNSAQKIRASTSLMYRGVPYLTKLVTAFTKLNSIYS